jgi:phosphoenolpyruvate-protein kinase (PTS system EI component)
MIWNPWKEIAKLREEIATKDAVLEMRLADWQRADDLATQKQKRIFEIAKERDNALEDNEYYLRNFRQIAAEEKPTSNATVKRICKIAQEVMDMHHELVKNRAREGLKE